VSAVFDFLVRLFQGHGETHPAVLAFIVLSGYCIHRSGFRRGPADHAGYGIRRFFRIYPVYLAATLFGLVVVTLALGRWPALAYELSGTKEVDLRCVAAKLAGVSAFAPSLNLCTFQGNAPLHTVMVEMWLYAA